MRLSWRPRAVADLEALREHIALEQPEASKRIAEHVLASADLLRNYPLLGRDGRARSTRELVVAHTPYPLVYRHQPRIVTIMRVLHGAQRWPRRKH